MHATVLVKSCVLCKSATGCLSKHLTRPHFSCVLCSDNGQERWLTFPSVRFTIQIFYLILQVRSLRWTRRRLRRKWAVCGERCINSLSHSPMFLVPRELPTVSKRRLINLKLTFPCCKLSVTLASEIDIGIRWGLRTSCFSPGILVWLLTLGQREMILTGPFGTTYRAIECK